MRKKVSIVIPFHWMDNWPFFLTRCLQSIQEQTFTDYEVVLINHSTMPATSNRVIESATGELVKILYLDDYLAHPQALQRIVDNFGKDDMWLATACAHRRGEELPHSLHLPEWNDEMSTGKNTIGSPSVITLRNEGRLLFDENLSWLLDADLYARYYQTYGKPKLISDLNVVIGVGEHQMTHKLTDEEKLSEHQYMNKKNA
jgi:hypothetical protein